MTEGVCYLLHSMYLPMYGYGRAGGAILDAILSSTSMQDKMRDRWDDAGRADPVAVVCTDDRHGGLVSGEISSRRLVWYGTW